MKTALLQFIRILKKEIVFTVAILLAVLSSFFVPVSADYLNYPDYRVLALLFCLMFVVAGFREQGVFRYLGKLLVSHAGNELQLEIILVLLCFFGSMWITNDVALITFVPFSMEILTSIKKEKHLLTVIVLQTIAANLGSMLTPIGNPQNLYLYSLSGMSFGSFICTMLPLTAVSLAGLLLVLLLRGRKEGKEVLPAVRDGEKSVAMQKTDLCLLGILFLTAMGTVLRLIPYGVPLAAVILVGVLHFRKLFGRVDYFLLGTFTGFFVFVGNVQKIPAVSRWIGELIQGKEFILSVLCSQVISNVPATMLLSGFTGEYEKLLWGVNVGGLGTLIASLASLISYKFYAVREDAQRGRYLLVFTGYNLLFLLVLIPIAAAG